MHQNILAKPRPPVPIGKKPKPLPANKPPLPAKPGHIQINKSPENGDSQSTHLQEHDIKPKLPEISQSSNSSYHEPLPTQTTVSNVEESLPQLPRIAPVSTFGIESLCNNCNEVAEDVGTACISSDNSQTARSLCKKDLAIYNNNCDHLKIVNKTNVKQEIVMIAQLKSRFTNNSCEKTIEADSQNLKPQKEELSVQSCSEPKSIKKYGFAPKDQRALDCDLNNCKLYNSDVFGIHKDAANRPTFTSVNTNLSNNNIDRCVSKSISSSCFQQTPTNVIKDRTERNTCTFSSQEKNKIFGGLNCGATTSLPNPKPVPRKLDPYVRPTPKPRKSISQNTLEQQLENAGVGDKKSLKICDQINVINQQSTESPVPLSEIHNSKSSVAEKTDNLAITQKLLSNSHITEKHINEEPQNKTILLKKTQIKKECEESGDKGLNTDFLLGIHGNEILVNDSDHIAANIVSEQDNMKLKTENGKVEKEVKLSKNVKMFQINETELADTTTKETFEDLFSDKNLFEPSSLLNEIEDLLTRSFKHSSLSRSESSPEKKTSTFLNDSRHFLKQKFVDPESSSPVRPPRPKKEQKRTRSVSKVADDSCESDSESLPDHSKVRRESFGLDSSNKSLTLGPAKPHPPKPKRNKLLKVQRSQSDITTMKSIVDKLDDSNKISPPHQQQLSDTNSNLNAVNIDAQSDVGVNSPGKCGMHADRPQSCSTNPPNHPTQKACSPPAALTSNSNTKCLDTVELLNNLVRFSHKTKSDVSTTHNLDKNSLHDTAGSCYSSINDDSDGGHDYHEISNGLSKASKLIMRPCEYKTINAGSPPKLPPRNSSDSHSLGSSDMLSSVGLVLDIASSSDSRVAECSNEVLLAVARNKAMSNVILTSSSPSMSVKSQSSSTENILNSDLGPSNSSLSDSTDELKQQPASASIQSDIGSEYLKRHTATSSESEGDDNEKISEKKHKKLFMIAKEVASSERVFVDVLRLLNVDFRFYISCATAKVGHAVIPTTVMDRILEYLPQLQNFNEELLQDLDESIFNWDEEKGIADVFVKKGPFLKLYSAYIKNFEGMTTLYDESLKKYPEFQQACKEFEMSPRCAGLALQHYMLKPIQRIPQYRLLLQDYMRNMLPDSPEMKEMQNALAIVSEVAHHANENMRNEDYMQKLMDIQKSLIGDFEVIKPGRVFLKDGELMKLSRKEMQPRYFFLFNDVLLYTTPSTAGYKLNNVLPLAGMKISVQTHDEYILEFNIISTQRSFTVHGKSTEERDNWVLAINKAIEDNAKKRTTFESVNAQLQTILDKDFVLGRKAPPWIPDDRVTMCMLCTCEFTVTRRRHHCRACGWVVCGSCSNNSLLLRYKNEKAQRVCDSCFSKLSKEAQPITTNTESGSSGNGALQMQANGLLERLQKIRQSGRKDKKQVHRPERLKEVPAYDEGALMSGYLQQWVNGKKWKKYWFLIKNNVLYTFRATKDTAAKESMVLLGYEVKRFTESFEGMEPDLLFQLVHKNTLPEVFRCDSPFTTSKWVDVILQSTKT